MLNYSLITIIVFTTSFTFAVVQPRNCTVGHDTPRSWSVDCSFLNLSSFPQNILGYPVKNLTFVHNNLNSSTVFGVWKDLEHLNIAYNKLTYIANETFSGLERLIYLNVSFNEIKIIRGDVFSNLPTLKILDLSGNKNLGKDNILVNALNGILYKGLKKLYITDLDLSEIENNFFDRANELILLDISNNNLTILPIFPVSLKILDISNNSFSKLTLLPFYHSRNIYTLMTENNKNLCEVENDAFHRMPDLKYISFKGCSSLDDIYYGTFYSNHKLQYLSIASCNFKTIPTSLKTIFFRIDVLDLQDNPWHCNAAIKWFFKLDIPKNLTKNLRCTEPNDMPLLDYYGPKHHHEILKIILGVLVIFVFLFFGVGLFFAYEMERKRKLAHPYILLGREAPVSSPIYISTVV